MATQPLRHAIYESKAAEPKMREGQAKQVFHFAFRADMDARMEFREAKYALDKAYDDMRTGPCLAGQFKVMWPIPPLGEP